MAPAPALTAQAADARSNDGITLLHAAQLEPGRARLDQAVALLDEAIYRSPTAPRPWYALGLVKLELSRRRITVKAGMHQSDGETWRQGAMAAFVHSLAADSAYAPAAASLAEMLVPRGESKLSNGLGRVVRVAARAGTSAAPLLVLGRVYRDLDQTDSALMAFRTYEQRGGDGGIAALEQARILESAGQGERAATIYLAGVERAGPDGRALYRSDLAWIATPVELAAFDSTSGAATATWVREFWQRRDAKALRAPNEPLIEHMRRWRYVHDHFRVVGRQEGTRFAPGQAEFRQPGEGTASMALQESIDNRDQLGFYRTYAPAILSATTDGLRIVDDRGIIYMRHGEPDVRVAGHRSDREKPIAVRLPSGLPATAYADRPTECTTANESWKYSLPTGQLIFHFCGSYALGTSAATTLQPMLPLDGDMLASRTALDPEYGLLAAQLEALEDRRRLVGNGAPPSALGRIDAVQVDRIAAQAQSDIRAGLSTDDYVQRYDHSLEPIVQLYAAGSPGSADARLLMVFAVPGARLTPMTEAGTAGVMYPLAVRVIAVGPAGLDVARHDTLRYFHTQDTLRAGAFLTGVLALPMPPGTHDVRVLFTQPNGDAAAAAGRDGMTLGQPGALSISDIIAGSSGSGLGWPHSGTLIPLNALNRYPRKGAIELYYDLAGLVPGRRYRTSIDLSRRRGAARDSTRVTFEDRPAATAEPVQRSLDLRSLSGGRYRLVVTVEDVASGAKVSRERDVNVEESR